MKWLIFILLTGLANACPYCAAGDSIGSPFSVYLPLAGIIIVPFILSALFIYVTKKLK